MTNGSFLDANNMDGLRKCLTEEFSHLYVFNLRGNARTQGEERRKEGGGIFDAGSRTPVAVTIMVKDPAHAGPCELRYHDIGDYLTREEKLSRIEEFGNIDGMDWQRLTPNAEGDWANQRDPAFDVFTPLGGNEASDRTAIFSVYSLGVGTNRDAWVYNYSHDSLCENMSKTISFYNAEVERYAVVANKSGANPPKIEDFVNTDPKQISWSSSLLPNVGRGRKSIFDDKKIVPGLYRPYSKQWLYFDSMMNHRVGKWPLLLCTPKHRNLTISATGIGAAKAFSALVMDVIPNLHTLDSAQCFPLYWYEKAEEADKAKSQSEMFAAGASKPDAEGYIRHDAITDWALATFRDHYHDQKISKEDIFWYVYGILHSPEYKQRFATDLKKMLPRIPFAQDFRPFCEAGRKLGEWHLKYETVEPFPLTEESKRLVMEGGDYRVSKIVFGKKEGKPDKSVIIYNEHLTLRDIPLEAYDYVVNGKPALEWIMERYAVTVDKASGIKNDPNAWSEDPRYIVDLVKRIVRVSVESARIVKALPALDEAKN